MLRVVHGTVFHGTKIPLQNLLARGNLQVPGSGHRFLGDGSKWAVCLYSIRRLEMFGLSWGCSTILFWFPLSIVIVILFGILKDKSYIGCSLLTSIVMYILYSQEFDGFLRAANNDRGEAWLILIVCSFAIVGVIKFIGLLLPDEEVLVEKIRNLP